MSDFREQYEAIKAPDTLRKRVDTIMKQQTRNKKTLHRITGAVVAAAACVAILNISPVIAYAADDIPVIGSIVRVLTFGRFTDNKNGYEADIVIPKVEGLGDSQAEERLNNELADKAAEVIAEFERDAAELNRELDGAEIHKSMETGVNVLTDNDKVFSINYWVSSVAASGSESSNIYTIDKQAGVILSLSDLFQADSPYVSVLSDSIREEMLRRNSEESGMFFVAPDDPQGFESIAPDQSFYINDVGRLVICFDEYEVAAGAQGSPQFEIPPEVIASIKDSALLA